jgi:DNA-binding NarL/FixJ family response regulator
VETLTPREKEVICLLVDGLTNLEIGKLLGIQETAVKTRLRDIYDKLGLDNRVQLALWYEARRLGIVTDTSFVSQETRNTHAGLSAVSS